MRDEEPTELPFPSHLGALLTLGEPGEPTPSNRSLLFDKGLRWNSVSWTLGAGGKEEFLREFSSAFRGGGDHYTSFLARREAALFDLGVQPISFTTQTRLVIGLGLPSPLETGFLLDRLTGCPYLPGSSVKGMLRAAARLIRQGELEGEKSFWDVHLERIFGPEIAPSATPKTGSAIFYDALPTRWPKLEVDVLTPHYGKYYRDGAVPGDWDNPIPVPFLAVASGTMFNFYIQAGDADSEALQLLLSIALDWLGIGAKKSAGYGTFGSEVPQVEALPNIPVSRPKHQKPVQPPPPPPPSRAELSWENCELSMRQGIVTARKGKQTATCARSEINQDVLSALMKNRSLRAEVDILKIPGSDYRLVRIRKWSS